MTAKIKHTYTFPEDKDLAGYVLYPFSDKIPVFHRDWYQDNVLLWRKKPPKKENLEEIDMKKLLGDRFRKGISGGKSAIETENMQVMDMAVVQITGKSSLEIHFRFKHPYF